MFSFGTSRLDSPSIKCCSRQCWVGPHSFVDSDGLCWVDVGPTLSGQEGIKVVGNEDWFHREWPHHFFMTVTILLLFGSAFFTDIIGVNAIFGASYLLYPRIFHVDVFFFHSVAFVGS